MPHLPVEAKQARARRFVLRVTAEQSRTEEESEPTIWKDKGVIDKAAEDDCHSENLCGKRHQRLLR